MNRDATDCMMCARGKYTGVDGSSECVSCESGKKAADLGASACDICLVWYSENTCLPVVHDVLLTRILLPHHMSRLVPI